MLENLNEVIAAGRVAADGTTNGAGFYARGCAVARSAQGIYTVTINGGAMSKEIDSTECVIKAIPETAARQPHVAHTSDNVKTINFADNAGAAQDSIFQFEITRTRNFMGG